MEDYLIHTRNSFDKIAGTFDEEDISNEILQWMRNVVYDVYFSCFRKGDRLLEINAGTGIDAVHLASKGITVFATDISPEMIHKLKIKIEESNLSGLIQTGNFSFDEIHNINENDFDGVISNFGGLNCINNFGSLSESLAEKLKPGGRFVAAVMNSFCPWEIFYFLMKLDSKNAFRRFKKNGIDANLSRFKIKSFYFSPGEFAGHFKKYFETEKIYSLGLFTPPPYLYGIYEKAKPAVKFFMKLDDSLKGIFPLSRIGDHFVIILKRKKN
jgi:ubiquinone/menaquinone biosynthesis C-methylase UbiE